MKTFLPILTGLILTGSASAQTTYLSEDFNGPGLPTGWTEIQNGANLDGWVIDAYLGRLWHEDYPGSTTDNYYLSPVMDLSSASTAELRFDGRTRYPTYMANHPTSNGDGVSTMEITADGGLTWTVIWTDTTLVEEETYSPRIDLSAYLGQSSVQLGIHFYGTFAHEWWVDDVVVDSGFSGPTIRADLLTRGSDGVIDVSHATPGGYVAIAYSLSGNGPTLTPYGVVELSQPILTMDTLLMDAQGEAQGIYRVPAIWAAAAYVDIQAVDLATGLLSNPLDVRVY